MCPPSFFPHAKPRSREEDKDNEWRHVLPLARQFTPPIESRKDYFPSREAATGESFSSREARSREEDKDNEWRHVLPLRGNSRRRLKVAKTIFPYAKPRRGNLFPHVFA